MANVARPMVSVFVGLSLDGFIAGRDGDLSWLSVVETDPPEDTGYAALMASVDALVIGRNTYDVIRSFDIWPYAGKHVVVLTHRPLVARQGEQAHAGDLTALLAQLAARGLRHVYLDGGNAIRQGLAAGAVDHLTLSWVPMTLGQGVPLFGPDIPTARWRRDSSHAFPSGLVQARYTARREEP